MSELLLPPEIARNYRYQQETIEKLNEQDRSTQSLLPALTYPTRPAPGNGLDVVGWWEVFVTPPGVWKNVWQSFMPRLVHASIRLLISVATDSTGSGVMKLSMSSSAGVTETDELTLPLNVYEFYSFNWLHEQPLWTTTDCFVTVMVKTNSSNVGVFAPYGGGIVQREPLGATIVGF